MWAISKHVENLQENAGALIKRFLTTPLQKTELEQLTLLLHADASLTNSNAQQEPQDQQSLSEPAHKVLLENCRKLIETELQKRTFELEEKMQDLETLANNISGGIELCELNERFTIRYISDGFLRLTGFSRKELIGKPHTSFLHPADVKSMPAQVFRQLETSDHFSVVYRIVRKDGETRWILDNGSKVRSAHNGGQVQSFLTDITLQKRQEEQLRISQMRYEVAIQQLNISMFEYDIATRQLFLYEEDASLYGLPTIIENGPRVLAESGHFDAECIPGYLEMYRKICSGEETFARCLITAYDIDDKYHESELSLTAVLDEAGSPIRAIGVKKSVSNRLKLQREQEFGKSMSGNRSFICEADVTNDHVLEINPAWQQELGVSLDDSYSDSLKHAAKRYHEHEEIYMLERLDAKRLTAILNQGGSMESFSFRKFNEETDSITWHEITVNIIREDSTKNICIRIYHEDISERRRKENQAEEERRLYESMVAKAMVAYEANITRDLALRGHEEWSGQFDIATNTCYSEMIHAFAHKGMDPQDSARFMQIFDRQHVLLTYYHNEHELSCQYRKLDGKGGHLWVECTMHLFEDPENADVRCYAYVENIDKQKRAELELRYKAEHDSHTKLYNRETTATLIGQYLKEQGDTHVMHAFFMVDLDYFKNVNDHFGHVFGDEVIADMGSRIRTLFRGEDIVGRLGGDEFCVFMKNVGNKQSVLARADKLCHALIQTYQDDVYSCTVSASVGVALYPQQGRNFEELYRCADNALYDAKRNGRSRYTLAE